MVNRTDKQGEDGQEPSAQDLFQSLVAKAEEGIVVLEPNRAALYANSAAEFLLGRKREELEGEVFDLPLVVSDEPTKANVVSADGRVRLVEFYIKPLPAGQAGSLVVRLRDITAYHQDVVRAREEVRRRDEFLAMLSHELRNPLSAISSAAQLLAREDLGTQVRQGARDIFDRQFQHLRRLLDDLLDITRISRGKLEVRKERVDLNQVVRDAVEAVMPHIRKRNHSLSLDTPQEQPWVQGDPTRLAQVVVNLLNNAAKFTPPQGHLSLTVKISSGEVEIRVCDDGPGIPDELLPHIFDPFVQGRQTLARSEGGLGLGLSLADAIVRLHGGSISARPNEDCPGVALSVRLPLEEVGTVQQSSSGGAPTVLPLRILLVEDSEDARRMLKDLLRLEGHEVLEASDGPSGLTAVLEQQPNLALVDIGLPGLDGYELARRARQDERGRRVPLIALTGYGMPQDIHASREAGFDGHLAKPLRYPDLDKLLKTLPGDRRRDIAGTGSSQAAEHE